MPQQPPTWVLWIPSANRAEALTWRPPDNAVDPSPRCCSNSFAVELDHILQYHSGTGKVMRIGRSQNGIVIESGNDPKACFVSTEREPTAPREDIQQLYLPVTTPIHNFFFSQMEGRIIIDWTHLSACCHGLRPRPFVRALDT